MCWLPSWAAMSINLRRRRSCGRSAWTIRHGCLFAEMSGLLGLSAMAEAVTRDPANIRMVKERSQVRGEERRQVFSNCFFRSSSVGQMRTTREKLFLT